MVKRILKNIKIDNLSKGEHIITIEIFSDVPFLDKNFLSNLLDEPLSKQENISNKNYEEIINKLKKDISKMEDKYNIPISQDMSEQDVFITSLSKQICSDVVSNFLQVSKKIIKDLVDEVSKVEKTGTSTPKELQNHLSNIIKMIDIAKSHLAYVPLLKDRDKLMFLILEDIKKYVILGEKFTKIENMSTFWKFREEMNQKNGYDVGIKSKKQIPPIR